MWSHTCLQNTWKAYEKWRKQTSFPKPGLRQSWTKVLGTVLRYSYFSVICWFPLKTVHPFRSFLAVLPPPTLYKVETRNKFRIHASNIVCWVRGGVGPVWIGKRPRKAKVSGQDFCPYCRYTGHTLAVQCSIDFVRRWSANLLCTQRVINKSDIYFGHLSYYFYVYLGKHVVGFMNWCKLCCVERSEH